MTQQPTYGRDPISRTPSLRLRLAVLVAGTMLPMLLFAIGLIYVNHQNDREAAFERVMETVRGIRLVLDTEMTAITAGLQVVAQTQALQRGDIESFRLNAMAFLNRYPDESALLLADRDNRQILNTRVPSGQLLPPRQNRAMSDEVFRTGGPVYSRLFVGSVARQPIITVDVPVKRGNEVAYVLSFNPPMSLFQRIVEQQRPDDQWTVSIFDQDGVNFARMPNPGQTVGQRASPTLYAELFKSNEARINTVSLEGVPLLTAFSRSPTTGWTVAAGIAESSITAPLWRTLAYTTAIGLVLLAIGMAFAIGMAAQIARGEALHALLINELNHRVKNTLATVQSIATQTFQPSADITEARKKFGDRVVALGRANSLLSQDKWESTDVRSIAESVLEPYMTGFDRLKLHGPHVVVPATEALMLAMMLHELATNASKYGALSNEAGKIDIAWQRQDNELVLTWRESDGPPVVAPTRKGFGTRLIQTGLSAQGRPAEFTYSESGLVCVIYCKVAKA